MSLPLICDRQFWFDDNNTNKNLSVIIKESIDKEFGSYTWPSAAVLAQFLWCNRKNLNGKSFVEVGCGTGLPSIIAVKCLNPTAVILTDRICSAR